MARDERAWWGVVLGVAATTLTAPLAEARTVTIRDYIGVDWENELVHYPVELAPGRLKGAATARVSTGAGKTMPCQVGDVVRHGDGSVRSMNVWFLASVPANGAATYTITPGQVGPAHRGVTVKTTANTITLTTRAPKPIGIRLRGGAKTYAWPVPAKDVPGPVEALLLPSGRQAGRGRFEVPFLVKSYRADVVANGPLFAEARVRYVFDVGYWTFCARVLAGCPMVLVEEELNTGYSGQVWDQVDRFYSLVLSGKGFRPTQAFYTGRTDKEEFHNLLKQHVQDVLKVDYTSHMAHSAGTKVNGYTLSYGTPGDHYYLTPFPTWSPRCNTFIRFVEPGKDAIGFAAVKSTRWRNPLSLRFRVSAQGELLASLPLQTYEQFWSSEGFHRISPNATGKTLYVPANYSRRHYGIMLSPAEDELKGKMASLIAQSVHLGAQTLDEVKDWILDWPDPMAGATWAKTSTKAGKKALGMIRGWVRIKRTLGNFGSYSMWTHRSLTHIRYPVLNEVIDSPKAITAAERRELRRLCAFQAYVLNSLDEFPWGVGCHLGNPNMSIMAVNAHVKSAVLVKDHPMFKTWGRWTLAFMKDYIRRFTRESGAPYECPHYTVGVTLLEMAESNQVLIDAGIGDAFDSQRFRKCMHFMLDWLTPPDPRFNGYRVVLPLGNTSYQSVPPKLAEQLITYCKQRDPVLAGKLQWWANQTLPEKKQVKIVRPVVPTLSSGHYEDYGVFFRHGYGTPHETLFHLFAGNCLGHYEISDQMSYTLYAKGQPIHLHFGNGYFPMLNRPWLRNRVSIDHKMEMWERHYPRIPCASFTPPAEYAHATMDFDQIMARATEYPVLDKRKRCIDPWPPVGPVEQIPLVTWHRQVLFLKDADPKGPNYFVLRDAFSGTPTRPTDLSLWFLANGVKRTGNVFHYDGQCKVDMDVFVGTPETFDPGTGTYSHRQQPYRRHTGFDPKYHPGGKRGETQICLRLRQPAGKGYLVVLYPRLKQDDPPASFARLARSAVKITTPLGTDYAFLSPFPVTYKDNRVRFKGMAAAVRFHKSGKVVVVNTEGKAEVSVAGKTVAGRGAFVVMIDGGKVVSKTYGERASAKVD